MAADDAFSLDGDSIQQLRDDHSLLMSMIRSPAGRRTVLYPSGTGSGGSGGPTPYIITEVYGGENVAYFGYVSAFEAKLREGETDAGATDDDVTVSGEYLTGIVFTGSAVLVDRIGGIYVASAGGRGMRYSAFTDAAIDAEASGDVRIKYTDAFGDGREATVGALNKSGRGLLAETEVLVDLIGSEDLWIVEGFC